MSGDITEWVFQGNTLGVIVSSPILPLAHGCHSLYLTKDVLTLIELLIFILSVVAILALFLK